MLLKIFACKMKKDLVYQPVRGKTYSLFGSSDQTGPYYRTIRSLADEILISYDINKVLSTIKKYTSGIGLFRKLRLNDDEKRLISYCLKLAQDKLSVYTTETAAHLKNLPLLKRRDRRLATTREQYHLYMFEIELTNRLNRARFLGADRKISLQPYCLQDFDVNCKADRDGLDYRCKSCSVNCFQNYATRILKGKGIESYIWMEASLSSTARETFKKGQTLGILGIACIPELVNGMRRCMKHNIPAVGIPLNANRCIRWFGEFHPNSVDLEELEKLVSIPSEQIR